MSRKKSVLVVVAHADDLEFMAGGTVARFTGERAYPVYEFILTDNSRGSYRLSPEALVEISAREAEAAGRILGLCEVRLGGYLDARLNEENPNVLRDKIISMIREMRADIIMSWDPFAPGEDHPDHRVVAMATLEAASFSGNPLFVPECPFPPHPVTEAYWFAKVPWHAEMRVDVSSTMDTKIAALLAHDCQMRLTVDALIQEAAALDADFPLLTNLGEDGYPPLVEAGVRDFCRRAGEPAGMAYAELFRYENLSGLDRYFGAGLVRPDFA